MYDQTPDPEELNLVDESTGISVKGTMNPDTTLDIEKLKIQLIIQLQLMISL